MENTLTTAINVRCPNCMRKLCKITEDSADKHIEIKHKGLCVLAYNAIIGCVDCKKMYSVDTQTGLIEEYNCG